MERAVAAVMRSAGNVRQLQSDSFLLMSAPPLWRACRGVALSPFGRLEPVLDFPRTDGVKGGGAFMLVDPAACKQERIAKHLKIDVSHGLRCQMKDVLARPELHDMGGGGQGHERGVSEPRTTTADPGSQFSGLESEPPWAMKVHLPPGPDSASGSTWSARSWCQRAGAARGCCFQNGRRI